MPVRPVVRLPEPVLTRASLPVERVDDDARALAADLVDTMRASPACVGLAAPQIGVSARAFCLDVSAHKKAGENHGLVVMINPVIELSEETATTREGCMSLPEFTGNVRRAVHANVIGYAPTGEIIRLRATDLESRAFQHEIDHLDGL